MVKRPRFKESLYVQVVAPDATVLISEHTSHLLTGPAYAQLAPLLTGEYTVPMLAALLADSLLYAHLRSALNRLEDGHFVVEADDALPNEQTAFWHALDIMPAACGSEVQQKRVVVKAVGDADAQDVMAALASLDISTVAMGDLWVVITDDYLQADLAVVNRQALAQQQPWLLARLVGESIWVGPLFVPGETACWACMAHRIQINRPVENFVARKRLNTTAALKTARAALPSTLSLGANLIATESAKWLFQQTSPRLRDQLVTLHTLTLALETHQVVRRPQCPSCGDPTQVPQPIVLQSSPKKDLLSPEAALARYKRQISPHTGVVTHLVDVLSVPELAHSYISVHGFGRTVGSVQGLRRNLQGRSSGKGQTETQAQLSAIGEAVERYSGAYWDDGEPSIRSSYAALGATAINPNDVWLFSEQQLAERNVWNQNLRSSYHVVFEPIVPTQELSWVPFWSLSKQMWRYFPAFSSYFGHPDAYTVRGACDSNGCAAGPTLEHAILKGMLELIERDCAAMWWYNRIRRPRVDLASFDLPYVQALQTYYEGLNRSLWVIDITADFAIPTFVAVSGRTDCEVEDILIGLGIDFDPRQALLGALGEVNQFLVDVRDKNPDGSTNYHMDVEETLDWFKTARMVNHSYLQPDDQLPTKTLADYPYIPSADTCEEVEICVLRAAALGLETLVLNQSRPDIEIPVVRVVVPGLRHFWRRLAPGRLYDVPVKLGWLERPLPEAALNPVSMFF